MRKIHTNIKHITLIILFGILVYAPYAISIDHSGERQYYSGDSWWYMEIVRSIVQDGDLDMSNNIPARYHVNQKQLALSKDQYLAPKHGIFFPIGTIPFYLVFQDLGFPIFNLFLTILVLVFMYRILCSFFDYNIALYTTLIYGIGSIILPYSYNYLSDLFALVLILIGLDFGLREKYYTSTLFLALSVLAKITYLLWIIPIALFIAQSIYHKNKSNPKEVLKTYFQLLVIFLISLSPLLLSNYLLYGGIFTTGYQRIVSYTMDGQIRLLSHTSDFHRPFLEGLNLLLFHAKKGMLWDNYLLIIAAIGVLFFRRLKQQWAIFSFLLIILLQFIFYSKYKLLLATEYGNRFLFLTIMLSSVFFANVLDIIVRYWKNRKKPKHLL